MFSVLAYQLAKRVAALFDSGEAQLKTTGAAPQDLVEYLAAELQGVLKRLRAEGEAMEASAVDMVKADRPLIDAPDAQVTAAKFNQSAREAKDRACEYFRRLRQRGVPEEEAMRQVLMGLRESCEAVLVEA